MALQNFLPGANGGAIDPASTYLIKGETLRALLRQTLFALTDFEVKETPDQRTVSLKHPLAEHGLNFNLILRDVNLALTAGEDPPYSIEITQNYEPYEFSIRDGKFTDLRDESDVPTYAFIGRITTNGVVNTDSGPVYYAPGEYES